MKRTTMTAMLLLLGGLAPAHAQQDQVDCKNAQTQQDMNYCSEMDFEKADKELNAVYKKAMASQVDLDKQSAGFNPEYVGAAKALKKAQRAWIDYRDGQCEGVGYEAVGGTMQPMLISGCKADLTEKRVKELKELIKGMGN
jgi:uncharacterized protein YecT (DUF1311 family)